MPTPDYFSNWYVNCWSFIHKDKWTFVPEYQAERYLKKTFGNAGICSSIFKYPGPIESGDVPDKEGLEYGNLFFDFDGVSDSRIAHADAIALVEFFTEGLDLDEEHIQVYFSGKKGYHVYVNASAFGIAPMPHYRDFMRYIATVLNNRIGLNCLDLSIYNFGRNVRYPNSQHQDSKLYKIWLPISTLRKRPSFYIKAMASQPGPKPPRFNYVEQPQEDHLQWYREMLESFSTSPRRTSEAGGKNVSELPAEITGKLVGLPACVQDLLDRFIVSGLRAVAQVPVISYFKAIGADQETVMDILEDRIRENYQDSHPPSYVNGSVMKMKSAVRAIYAGAYDFKCAYALGVTKYETDPAKKVKCIGGACPLFTHCGGGNSGKLQRKKKEPV